MAMSTCLAELQGALGVVEQVTNDIQSIDGSIEAVNILPANRPQPFISNRFRPLVVITSGPLPSRTQSDQTPTHPHNHSTPRAARGPRASRRTKDLPPPNWPTTRCAA